MSLPGAAEVAERAAQLRDRIVRAGGDPACIELVAVTKGHGPEVVDLAMAAGLYQLGENYAQELLAKAAHAETQARTQAQAAVAGGEVTWHFIGHLQRNKVRALAGVVGLFQTVDRAELVEELAKRAPGAAILVQVNATGEAQKSGCAPAEVAALVANAQTRGLVVRGLMTVGPTADDTDPAPGFRATRRLVDELGLAVCSMGMTGDLEIAVGEGSTMVRVGTALFGPREPARPRSA